MIQVAVMGRIKVMANGFGSLYIGAAGLQTSQNALNTTANNLANIDTTGYVRQVVYQADRDYYTFDKTAAESWQQSGLGVVIGDVIHSRDIFLDQNYRTESARQAFYQATYDATSEVETYFQEMEGEAFQNSIEDLWQSIQELANNGPDDEASLTLFVLKSSLFLSRAQSVYTGLQSYQYNINTQISDDIDRVNELGKTIYDLNAQICKVEAGGIETAMTLRDERDNALDELSSLVNISYSENSSGVVRVSVEGTEFVTEGLLYTMGQRVDKVTGFVTPYWEHLSDEDKGKYVDVFKTNTDISSENKNDRGELKALILARGDHIADYRDVEGMSLKDYNNSTGMSVMMQSEAEIDQLVHKVVTKINDILCPNTSASESQELKDLIAGGATITYTDSDGNPVTINNDTLILDTANCDFGSDGKLPPQELFSRIGTDRYQEVSYEYTDASGTTKKGTLYLYNEESETDSAKMYTLTSLSINDSIKNLQTLLPTLKNDGSPDYSLTDKLIDMWNETSLTLNPNDGKEVSIKEYYTSMIGELGTNGSVYGSIADSLTDSVAAIDNSRQEVIGVSSDEELTAMIKYQNAYNASSRFINVINEMIETLLNNMG
jgi:flagellar hook-associated protein 1 FlgK